MRANKIVLLLSILCLGGAEFAPFPASVAAAAETQPTRIPRKKKHKFDRRMQTEFCTRLFEKEWETAVGTILEPVAQNGFRYGIGSKMKMVVDGEKEAEGTFLGRLVSSEYRTVGYMFQDYKGEKNYIIPPSRCKIMSGGEVVPNAQMQSYATTMLQEGSNCAELATVNFFSQLTHTGRTGNGTLKKELGTPEGWIKLQQYAQEYYTKTRGAYRFKPILKKLGDMYGFTCHSLEAVTATYMATKVKEVLGRGLPVLLEFFIGSDMVDASKQWVRTDAKIGEDPRFWAPREVGQKNGGGHALVAVGMFETGSGRDKLLISDSDWKGRPVEWDYQEYFEKRIKSSGMMVHYCE